MRKASWIVLTLAGVAVTLISLISAAHAYNKKDNYGIGGMSVSKVAADREAVATALRGIRGTSAAFATAYGVLFLIIVLAPYRRGDVWAWWALLASSAVLLIMSVLRIPFLHLTAGAETSGIFFGVTLVGLLLDVRRLGRRVPA